MALGSEPAQSAPLVELCLCMRRALPQVRLPIVQYSTSPAAGLTDMRGRQVLVAAARQLLERKAAEAGRQSKHFPILLNSSGVMVR